MLVCFLKRHTNTSLQTVSWGLYVEGCRVERLQGWIVVFLCWCVLCRGLRTLPYGPVPEACVLIVVEWKDYVQSWIDMFLRWLFILHRHTNVPLQTNIWSLHVEVKVLPWKLWSCEADFQRYWYNNVYHSLTRQLLRPLLWTKGFVCCGRISVGWFWTTAWGLYVE